MYIIIHYVYIYIILGVLSVWPIQNPRRADLKDRFQALFRIIPATTRQPIPNKNVTVQKY